jgi:serine protease Do
MVRRSLPVCYYALSMAVLLLTTNSPEVLGQDVILPVPSGQIVPAVPLNSQPKAGAFPEAFQPHVVQKPVVPASATKSAVHGMTYVAISPDLKSIADGREPTTLDELKALEKQQSEVAKTIQLVTVNIQQGSAQGSGVIITDNGYILTAAHVAGGPGRKATVILHDGTRLKAETMGMNRDHDAGLVRVVDGKRKFAHASLGQSKDLKVGQWVIGAGHPGGWQPDRGTVIRVGRIQRMIPRNRDPHTLFTDCALIGGDSGGPLFTLDGTLVGIHSRIGTDVSDNMHVPVDVFRDSWDKMARNEVWGVLPGFGPPYIGVKGGKAEDPAVLSVVEPDGPASAADLKVGDVVTSFDGKKITTFQDLMNAVKATSPGDVVQIIVRRGNQDLQMPIQIGTRKQ